MNRFIAIAAVAAATLAGAANAATSTDLHEIKSYAPSVDVSTLDDATVNAAVQAIHGSGSESEKTSTVRAILLNAN